MDYSQTGNKGFFCFHWFILIICLRFGRKRALILILFVYLLSSISPVFTVNYYAFVTCQAVNGSTFPISILVMIILGSWKLSFHYCYNVECSIDRYRVHDSQIPDPCIHVLWSGLSHWPMDIFPTNPFVVQLVLDHNHQHRAGVSILHSALLRRWITTMAVSP